jgi:hypothetical protein
MKIHQLAIGARFEYEGVEYVKSGPMFATGPAGQRMIPKYAVLKPLDPSAATADAGLHKVLAHADVLRAFAGFYARCADLVPEEKRGELEGARGSFLLALADSAKTV